MGTEKYKIAEKNARELLKTVFKGIKGKEEIKDSDMVFSGDVYSDSAMVNTKDGMVRSNIEVKYKSSPGPSFELNSDKSGVLIKMEYDEEGKLTEVKLNRNNSNKENSDIVNVLCRDILDMLNNNEEISIDAEDDGKETLRKKLEKINENFAQNKSYSMELELKDDQKEELLRLLYDRECFNEKIFCCINDKGFMSIIPRDRVEGSEGLAQYYRLTPKLEIRKGDNNLKAGEKEIADELSQKLVKQVNGESVFKFDNSIHVISNNGLGIIDEKIGSNKRLCIHTDKKIPGNILSIIEITLGSETFGLTIPNGYGEGKLENNETFYRYKIIKKSGTYRFKFMLNINVLGKNISNKYAEFANSDKHYIDEVNVKLTPKDNVKKTNREGLSVFNTNFESELEKIKNIIEGKENLNYNLWTNDTKSLAEDYDYTKSMNKYTELINDLYQLRQSSLDSEGEYGVGNLIFKKFRDLGYLDNLKNLAKEDEINRLSEDKIEQ